MGVAPELGPASRRDSQVRQPMSVPIWVGVFQGAELPGLGGVAWLSGPFAFCSVTELLSWPESGAAAARARRAQFAARAGPQPGPILYPARAGSTSRCEAGARRTQEGRVAGGREADRCLSGQVRAGATECTLLPRR